MKAPPTTTERVAQWLGAPKDLASLAVFRMFFGAMMTAGLLRFLFSGWVHTQFVAPRFHFKFYGLEWVERGPPLVMYGVVVALAGLALCIALGLFYRWAAALFAVGFAYLQLVDVTNYLNHYYFVVLMSALLALLPAHRLWSLDAWRRPSLRRDTLPAWMLYLVRFQVAVVYVYAGLAKAGVDWLWHAQPLGIWLNARSELPLIGPLLAQPWAPHAFSWAGFLFDTSIVGFLLWPRSRPFAYAVVLVFHALTKAFFDIGMFPFIMVVAATTMFSDHWPRRMLRTVGRLISRGPLDSRKGGAHSSGGLRMQAVVGGPSTPLGGMAEMGLDSARPEREPPFALSGSAKTRPWLGIPIFDNPLGLSGSSRGRTLLSAALVGYCLIQVLVPLRHFLYPGDVLWTEQGMRFSWKVMVREKNGSVTFHVTLPSGRDVQVSPSTYLLPRQANEMSAQPDLILQLAHHIAEDFRQRGHGTVQVRAEAWVSLNGRPPALLIDPGVDLAREQDGLAPKPWILASPPSPPVGRLLAAGAR